MHLVRRILVSCRIQTPAHGQRPLISRVALVPSCSRIHKWRLGLFGHHDHLMLLLVEAADEEGKKNGDGGLYGADVPAQLLLGDGLLSERVKEGV